MAALSSPIHVSDAEAPPEWLTVEQVADMLAIGPKALCDQITRQPENPRPVAKWFITPAIKDGKKSRFTLEQAHKMASLKTKKKAASALNLGLALDDGNATKENAPTTNEGADKNTLFDSTDYTPVSHAGGLSPVFSLFDSIGSKTPCQRIAYGDLVAMARNPEQVAKKAAPCFVPANVSAKTGDALASAEGYALIVADVDIHTTQGTIRCFLERYGITKALIYSTASSTTENHKNRVVIPLRAYCGYEQWAMLTSWLCCQLAGDATAERKTQVSFVPNRGAHYTYDEINTGEALDPQDSNHAAIRAAQDHAKALEAIEGDKQALALERALERENKRETAPSLANGGLSLIGAFNESYSVEMLLQKNGYKHKGRNKWLCPNSASGIAGAVILKDPQTGLERVYSHHSPESDPLANGRAHDAFSVFTALEHGGDEKSAVKAAGEMLPEITKANQDAYRKTKHTEHLERERQEVLNALAANDSVSQAGGWAALIGGVVQWPESYTNKAGKTTAGATMLNAAFALKTAKITGFIDTMRGEEITIHGCNSDSQTAAELNDVAEKSKLAGIRTMSPETLVLAARTTWPKQHPLLELIKQTEWDKEDRIKTLCECIKYESDDYAKIAPDYIQAWLVDGVLGWGSDGVVMDRVLVLAGSQGIGKTEFYRRLVPAGITGAVKSGIMLDMKDKDSVRRAVSAAIVELGELDGTFRKSDIAALKAFLSNTEDLLRPPYERNDRKFYRRTLFCASVNQTCFLIDDDNRRFLTLSVESIDWDKYNAIDKKQLWAQVLHIAKTEGRQTIDRAAQTEINTKHSAYLEEPAIQKIDALIKWPDELSFDNPKHRWTRIDELLTEINLSLDGRGGIKSKIGAYLRNNRNVKTKKAKAGIVFWLPVDRNPTYCEFD